MLGLFNWDVIKTVTNSLDKYTEVMMSYIRYCEGNCVSSHTWVSYNNDKPQFTATLRHAGLEKMGEVFRSGDKFKGS